MALESFIIHWGYPALFLGAFVEGDAAAFLGGVLAHNGLMSFVPAAMVVAVAAMSIDNLLFHMGRNLTRFPRLRSMTETPLARHTLDLLRDHPVKVILAFRFVWGTRTLTPPVVGMAGIDARLFFVLDAISVTLWSLVCTSAGYGLVAGLRAFWQHMDLRAQIAVGVVLVVGVGLAAWVILRRRAQKTG